METTYYGTVINKYDSKPIPDLDVKVTDGQHINKVVQTDASGFFSVLVRFNEINADYYLLIGNESKCTPVRMNFKGYGQKEIDLGVIEVEGQDPQNPYDLFVVQDGSLKYMVLPYDLPNADRGQIYYTDGDVSIDNAAKQVSELVAYNYSDWELPSISILELIYAHKDEIGGFVDQEYWSSSDGPVGGYKSYWALDFSTGIKNREEFYQTLGVRPVRRF